MTSGPNRVDTLRLVGIPGTNKVMAGELSRLAGRAFDGVRLPAPGKEGQGILVYPFEVNTAALAVRYHRTSSRVLWGLYQSRAARLEPLYRDLFEAVSGDERTVFPPEATFTVSPVNLGGFAAGERQVVGVVKNALIDGAARKGVRLAVNPGKADVHIQVSMHDDVVTVAIDLAGRPMNQRGYRTDAGVAPLRENLAAVLVMLSRHNARSELLLDPMAGSGTIAIEAACMAQGKRVWVPPRQPAARLLPAFSSLLEERAAPLFADTAPFIVANEIRRRTHGISVKNIAAAGVKRSIESWCGDYRKIDGRRFRERAEQRDFDPDRGLILSNPPYGERFKPDDLIKLYRELGRWCRQFPRWRAAFLVANPDFETAFGGRPRIKKPLRNGPLRGYFYLYDL